MYEVSPWAGHSSLNFTDRVYTCIAEKPDYTAGLERARAAKARKGGKVLPFPAADAG